MSAAVKAYMLKPIANAAEADEFVRALHADDKLFHFDDSAESIVDCRTDAPTFTPEECAAVDRRVDEMFALEGYDPFALAVKLAQEAWEAS
jgi:hypothetical protein